MKIIFSFLLFILAIKILANLRSRYTLSLNDEDGKYEYKFVILTKNSVLYTLYFYSNFDKYTVDYFLKILWNQSLNAYVFETYNHKQILCSKNELYDCKLSVEKNEFYETKRSLWRKK
ncbi:hypothetical protein ACIJDA_002760 [Enterococcus faecalis]|nr:hypothetical protein [Staphylococcus epidermidis]MDU2110008.1 hypothetical protein [Peptoniphilus lacydonensis]